MAAVDEIAIKLGVKTGDLKAALSDAGASIKKFKKEGESGADEGLVGTLKKSTKGLNDLKNVLLGGAIAGAVKGFFQLAIDAAQKSTDATDTNAAAVREFAKGLDEAKGIAASIAVTAVGAFNKLGGAIGDTINIAKSFIANGTQGFEVWARTQDAIEATGKAAEAAEKRLADVRKKNGAEFLAITKELADIEQKARDQKLKGLDVYETERNLLTKTSELRQKMNNFEGEAIDRRRLALELAKTQLAADDATLAVKKAQIDVEKKLVDDKKKAAEDAKKDQDELSKKRALDLKEEIELFALQRKNVIQLTAEEKKRKDLLELQKIELVTQVEIEELMEKKITDGLTPAEAARLDELIKQDKKIAEQIAKKQLLAAVITTAVIPAAKQATSAEEETLRVLKMQSEELDRQAQIERSRHGTVTQTGDVRNLNDTQLDQLIQNLNKSLGPIKQSDSMVGGLGGQVGNFKSIEQLMLQQNLDAAKQEAALRRSFAQTQNFFGDQGTQRTFAPDDYARLSQLFNPDMQKKDSNNLAAVAAGLAKIFPDDFSGVIR